MANRYPLSEFRYFFALGAGDFNRYRQYLRGQDILISFPGIYQRRDVKELLARLKAHSGKIVLDSGGFQNFSKPGLVKFKEWLEFVGENKDAFDEYVQFDDLRSRQKTVDNYHAAKQAGLSPHFVDHLWFRAHPAVDKIWKSDDKVALSGFARTRPGQEKFPGDPMEKFRQAIDKARQMDTVNHLLAVSSLKRFLPHIERINSVDSASWGKAPSYGMVVTLATAEIEGVKVPVTRVFSYPGARNQPRPMPSDVLKKSWSSVVSANGWGSIDNHNTAYLVSIYNIKRYISALRKFSPKQLQEALASKEAGARVQKMLDGEIDVPYTLPDVDPLDDSSVDFGWTVDPSAFAVMSKARAATREMLDQAQKAKRRDELTLGEFFMQPKPTLPAASDERQTVEGFLRMFDDESAMPVLVQKKHDGARHQIHRDGDKIKIISEDGGDNTARLPSTVKELLALDADKFVVDAEIEIWRGRQHMPREVVAGYLNSSVEADDSDVVVNVFDLLYLDKDIHKEPTEKRVAALKGLGISSSTAGVPDRSKRLNLSPSVRVGNLRDLERAVRRIRKLPGSEGVVAKRAAAPYWLDVATRDEWVKFHNSTQIVGVVIGRDKTRAGTWVYQWGVLPGSAKPKAPVTFGPRSGEKTTVVPVGDTFATKQEFKLYDEIVVEVETLNLTRSKEGIELSGWVPRVVGAADRKASTVEEAVASARRDLVLQVKEVDEEGETTYKRVEKGYKPSDEDCKLAREKKIADPYLEIPPEGEQHRFVVHHHWRGKGVHSDVRIEMAGDKALIGWTLNTQIAGSVEEPVESLAAARAQARRMDEISKINWNTGRWAERQRRDDKTVRTQILCERKAIEPHPWIDVEGKTKDPEPGEAPPIGGTRRHPGVFHIVDKGVVEYGAQKPWLHEYFFSGDGLNYRMFFRQLKLKTEKNQSYSHCMACKIKAPTVDILWANGKARAWFCPQCFVEWSEEHPGEINEQKAIKGGEAPIYFADVHKRASVTKAALPPSEDEGGPIDAVQWLAIYPDDPTPYVLGAEAVAKQWMPPDGFSALPAKVRAQVPSSFAYWKKKGAEAMAMRDELVAAVKAGAVKVDFSAPFKKQTRKASLTDAEFVLQEQTWRGPKQVRSGPTKRVWWLRIDVGRPELIALRMSMNPLDNQQVSLLVSEDPHRDSMRFEGDVKPGHYLNPTKDTPSSIRVLDRGKAEVLQYTSDLLKLVLNGKSLSGNFTAERNNGEWLWSESTSKAGSVEKGTTTLVKLNLPIEKVDKDKHLVTGVVLEPDEVDAQNDTISEAVIEKAAHDFVAKYNEATRLGFMHKLFGNIGVSLVESWITKEDTTLNGKRVKKGSWLMTVKVHDPVLWSKVKRGMIAGFSIGGVATVG